MNLKFIFFWTTYLLEGQIKSKAGFGRRRFSQKTNEQICFSILTTWKYLKSKFNFQFFPDCEDRKTNSSVRFLGEVMLLQLQKNNLEVRSSKEIKAQPSLHTYENGENKADVQTRVESSCKKSIWVCTFPWGIEKKGMWAEQRSTY